MENQDDIINQILEQQKELKRMAKHIEHGLKLMKSKLDAAIEQREHWTYHEAAPMQS